MTDFVLIGGAWIGAWAWRGVADDLRARGHRVDTPSLTGLADRVHLARPEVDLETHINDVVNWLTYQDLTRVVLVGHSYAAFVVAGVADRAADRLGALIYVDAGPVGNGACMLDFQPPTVQHIVDTCGDGWRLPFPGFPALGQQASLMGLGETEQALMLRKATAQPFATYTQRLNLTRSSPPACPRAMVLGVDGQQFLAFARSRLEAGDPNFQAMAGDDWHYRSLETGHWPMLSEPVALATALHELGGLSA